MHKLLQLANVGSSGVNTDLPQWELPVDSLTEGRNFRIVDGYIQASGGYKLLKDINLPHLNLGRIMPCGIDVSDYFIVGGDKGLYSWDGEQGSVIHETPHILTESTHWSFAMMGGIPVANHPEVGALYWYPVGHNYDTLHAAKFLPYDKAEEWNKPHHRNGKVIRAHKTFLFLLNLTEQVNGVPTNMIDSFRWSHPAPANSVPYTWNEGDQFALAGMANIGADTGAIVDGLSMRDTFIIYSDSAITLLSESGDEFVWNKRTMTSTTGLLSKDCVVEVKGTHFFIGVDDIYAFDGNGVESLMHNRLARHFRANLNDTYFKNAFALSNKAAKEVWFCIPDQNSTNGAVNLAYVYNWKDNSWALRDLPCAPFNDPIRNAAIQNVKHAVYGSRSQPIVTWKSLELTVPTPLWEEYASTWGTNRKTPYDDTVIALGVDNNFYDLDPSSSIHRSKGDAAILDSGMYIERLNFPINSVRNVTTIVTMYPKVKGIGEIKIKLGSHDYPGADVRWKGEAIFKIGVDRKVCMRTTGELHAWRIETIGAAVCEFSGMDLEFAEAGLR